MGPCILDRGTQEGQWAISDPDQLAGATTIVPDLAHRSRETVLLRNRAAAFSLARKPKQGDGAIRLSQPNCGERGAKGEIMSTVRLKVLLEAEAEDAIARVWRVLEAQTIATPHLKVTQRSSIAIELSFASSDDAEYVAETLRSVTSLDVEREQASEASRSYPGAKDRRRSACLCEKSRRTAFFSFMSSARRLPTGAGQSAAWARSKASISER